MLIMSLFTGEEDTLEEQLPVRSPAPDYTSLKKETQSFTKQVQDFFSGGKVIVEKVCFIHFPIPKFSTNFKAFSSLHEPLHPLKILGSTYQVNHLLPVVKYLLGKNS
jgi:hypothetical protein